MSMRSHSGIWIARLALLAAVAGPVIGCSDCDLSISTQQLPIGVVGESYAKQLDSDCGGDDWFLQTGDLPPGIGLEDDGDLIGIPTTVGIFTFTIGVVDFNSGEVAYKGFDIEVVDDDA